MSDSSQLHQLQHTRLLCPQLFPGVCANSCPLSWWCYLAISSPAALLSFAFNLSQHQCFSNESTPAGTSAKEHACQVRTRKRDGLDPWVGKIPCRRKWQPTPVLLPGEAHGQRSLVGCTPWGHKESGMTDLLTLTYLLKGIKMLIFLECLLGARYFHSLLFILTKILCGRR